ncbi:hypothetical protein HD806DRAFT_520218 [Xylariaceae sp. AK1471]|nr:hypothetical protein HD806DRAFT_520218 [Xylariaceae sp. AK1471]
MVSPTTIVPPKSEYRKDPSFDSLNLVAIDTGSSTQSSGSRVDSPLRLTSRDEECQEAVRGWEATVELLANSLRTSLQETYNEWEKDATPEGFDRICTEKTLRHMTIYRMRNASLSKMRSANLDFFPKYDVRFRNYDEIQKDLAKVRSLLGTLGIPQERMIIERRISPTGDAMLEFANVESEKYPVYRFRVSSHCLRETSSPIFGHMFNSHFLAELDNDLRRSLPSSPTRHVCGDGSEVKLYRMPQTELDTERSLEILLHAAHNHNDRVPRVVSFSQFVAIAEACLRYRCTSPLELAVEHLWLPYWRDQATDDMLGKVLLISYVFGLSENFTRLSRLAILTMTDLDYVQCKSWPPKVREKISAVRRAKIEQVYKQCRTTLNEYLYPASRVDSLSGTNHSSQPNPTSGLRCPRGDRTCDAQNLGWYMKRLTELDMLSAIVPSPAFHIPAPQNRSLLEIINSLCLITSPPQRHGGICDFAPAFRAAIKDIYNSLLGVTLFDVSGKRGWALSKNPSRGSRSQNQIQQQTQNNGGEQDGGVMYEQLFEIAARQRYAPGDLHSHRSVPTVGLLGDGGNDDDIYFRILSLLDNPRDLRAAALINKRFYRSYLRNETRLTQREGVQIQTPTHIAEADEASASEDTGTNVQCAESPVLGYHTLPREKFRHGQILLVEDKNKSLLESDRNKYAGDIREQLQPVGLQVGEQEGSRQSFNYF